MPKMEKMGHFWTQYQHLCISPYIEKSYLQLYLAFWFMKFMNSNFHKS